MTIDVINDRILVRPLPKSEQQTASGLYLPATAQTDGGRDTIRGEVLEVGEGAPFATPIPVGHEFALDDEGGQTGATITLETHRALEVYPGDVVYFGQYVGWILRDPEDGGELIVICETDVVAIEPNHEARNAAALAAHPPTSSTWVEVDAAAAPACLRATSPHHPCVIRDGAVAYADNGRCVWCDASPEQIALEEGQGRR